ncbi:MAG: zf-HC2 domain-containing protein, partial [bacterium]|nr:zf-HC2 domain-containing protein [Candidatus Kapabacteria bacterium]
MSERDPHSVESGHVFELLDRALSDELDAADRAIVDAHIVVCASCAHELDELRRVRDALRRAERSETLPDGLADAIRRDRIRDDDERSARNINSNRTARRWMYAIAATVFVAIGAWLVRGTDSSRPEIASGLPAPERHLASLLRVGVTDHIQCV